jgi:O-antigen/teichoic acid export membrane protein
MKKWVSFFREGHERSVKAKKNIVLAIVLKGLGVLIGFAYFPISLAYLGPAKFGIFLTLTSVIDWFSQLDIGIGDGLRNRLGEAKAEGNNELVRGYISTAYFAVGSIFSGIAIVFISACFFIPWSDWLNADDTLNEEITILAVLIFAAFAVNFMASLIYQVFYALQRMAFVELFSFITKLLFLVVILVLPFIAKDSLLLFGVGKAFTFALIPVLVGLYYFNNEFSVFRPSLRHVKRAYFNGLFSLGFKFFLIKISLVIIEGTNSLLIARLVAVEAVPQYEAAYKYLSVFQLLFVILTNQLWSANVEAYKKGEYEWIKKTMQGVTKIWIGTVLLALVMVAISPLVYNLWLQDKLEIPISLTLMVAMSICTLTWVNMNNMVLNGAGKVTLQMYGWLLASVLNIPLSIFFATTAGFGIIGIVLGTMVSLLPLAVLSPLQSRKLLAATAGGVWAK